jgi:hypothetical protein
VRDIASKSGAFVPDERSRCAEIPAQVSMLGFMVLKLKGFRVELSMLKRATSSALPPTTARPRRLRLTESIQTRFRHADFAPQTSIPKSLRKTL